MMDESIHGIVEDMPDELTDERTDGLISRRSFVQVAAGGIVAAAAGPGWRPDAVSAAPAKRGGTLTVALAGDFQTLDPHRSTLDVLRHTIRSMVFETLIFVGPDLKPRPALAESWQVSHDGKTLTFNLRKGVKFHDGSPFTAEDVAFTIHRVQNPKTASQFAQQVATVKRVEVVNAHTVRLHLSSPTPALVANMLQVNIVSQKHISNITKHPVGTGPFMFVEWIPGSHCKVVRNPHYYLKGLPLLDGILLRPLTDAQARLTNLQTGAVLLVETLDASQVQQVGGFANARVIKALPITLYENFQINTSRAPFNDKRVRQALSYAFDRESYVRSFWYGLARPGDNPFVKEMSAYLPGSDSKYTFNLGKTTALLGAAGFSQSKPLTMEILSPAGYSTLHAMAVILQNNLNKLGHKVTARDLELAAWIDRISAHADFDITTDGYNTVPEDPGGMFNSDNLAPKFNINRFHPAQYTALVNKAATEPNPQKRIQLYRQLQTYLLDEVPTIIVDHYGNLLGANKRVKGLVLGPSGIWDWKHVSI